MDYFLFQTKEVRDLAWLIRSPFLLATMDDAFCEKHFRLMEDKLRYWDKHPAELFSVLGQLKSPYLGHYFEKLMYFWLKHDEHIDLLMHNVQLREKDQTIGEIDFLVLHEGRLEHWEVAVKFYLGTGDGSEQRFWIGPNPVDRLDKKLKKLREKQLAITETAQGLRFLEKHGLDKPHKQLFMKGYLFYSMNQEQTAPPEVNVFHRRSWYLFENQMHLLKSSNKLMLKEKRAWLSPDVFDRYSLQSARSPMSIANRSLKKPQLYALLSEEAHANREHNCLFVVPKSWPGETKD